jgi:hypothetical protein
MEKLDVEPCNTIQSPGNGISGSPAILATALMQEERTSRPPLYRIFVEHNQKVNVPGRHFGRGPPDLSP